MSVAAARSRAGRTPGSASGDLRFPSTVGRSLTGGQPFARMAAAIIGTRCGSEMASISTILPPAIVNPITVMGCPSAVTTTPAALAGDRFGPADQHRCRGKARAGVDAQHDLGMEQRDERVEVPVASGS